MKLDILYEDNHLLIVNKKAGVLVQGDKTGDDSLLDDAALYIQKKYNKPGKAWIGLPHRLDRPTSGIVVLCRTSKSLERMNQIFKSRNVSKTYWAVVEKKPNPHKNRLTNFIKKEEKKNKSFIHSTQVKGSQEAILSYELIKTLDNYFLLEVELETGRHHQIRTQLAHMGCKIKGDVKYGARRANKDLSIHLHARNISFEHPVKKETLKIVAPPPNEPIWNACVSK